MAKPYLPYPHSDEIIGSVVLRGCRYLGLSQKRMVAKLTEGSSYLSFLLPLQLVEVAKAIGIDPRNLLQQHTMFPYVTAFMPTDKVASLEQIILSHPTDTCLGSLIASASQSVPFRRLCKACIEEDMQHHGETFWHRSHLLPGVHICARHCCKLWETDIKLRSTSLAMPDETKLHQRRASTSSNVLKSITNLSIQALGTRIDNPHIRHRTLAIMKGYLLGSAFVPTRELSRQLHHFFGSSYLDELKADFQPEDKNSWPGLLVRVGTKIEAAPSKHRDGP